MCNHLTYSPQSIRIREATHQDAESACRVVRLSIICVCVADHENDKDKLDAWLSNKTTDNFVKWINNDKSYSVLAADADNQVVGFALLNADELKLCYVHPEYLQWGIGKQMLQRIESYQQTRGAKIIRLESTINAKPFYLRNGYVDLQQTCNRGVLSCMAMEKRLDSSS